MQSPKTHRAHNMRPKLKNIITSILPRPGRVKEQAGSAKCVSALPGRSREACNECGAGRARSLPQCCHTDSPLDGKQERTLTAHQARQAVRSLGPLGCACYQASTRGLSTSCSGWDLDSSCESGKTPLGCGFALRCFQRLSLLDVAIQQWPRQANWLTSGPAISVLSYWR